MLLRSADKLLITLLKRRVSELVGLLFVYLILLLLLLKDVVDPLEVLEHVAFLGKAHGAAGYRTLEWLLVQVDPEVRVELADAAEHLAASLLLGAVTFLEKIQWQVTELSTLNEFAYFVEVGVALFRCHSAVIIILSC